MVSGDGHYRTGRPFLSVLFVGLQMVQDKAAMKAAWSASVSLMLSHGQLDFVGITQGLTPFILFYDQLRFVFQPYFEYIVIALGGRISVVDQVPALLQVSLPGKGVGID